MRTPFHAALLTLAMLAPAAPAFACSVVSTYRVPTNLELVEQAETILLGIAERHVPAETGSGQGEVVVRPMELLKGEGLPQKSGSTARWPTIRASSWTPATPATSSGPMGERCPAPARAGFSGRACCSCSSSSATARVGCGS